MNILFLTQVLPFPPDSGPKIKTLNVLKYLSQKHQVILVSFVRGDQEKEAEQLRKICRAVYTVPIRRTVWQEGAAIFRSFLSSQPWLILRDDRAEMRSVIADVVAKYPIDAVHADQLNMAQYGLRVDGVRRILDEHNALWLLYQRVWETLPFGIKKWLYGRDWKLLSRYEGKVCGEYDTVMAVSSEDRQALQKLMECDRPVEVIPITVDTQEVHPFDRDPEAGRILHVGTMFWPPNVDGIQWFLDSIYPLIERERPGTAFDIVGARPPVGLIETAARYPAVKVHGYVENLQPFLRQAGVFVVPLRSGGGMRVKILESLAQGLPIVTTSIGCEGIPVENGKHLIIADSPQEFAAAILKLLADADFARQLGRNGRQLIEAQFDYRTALKTLDRIYPVTEQADPHHEIKFPLQASRAAV